MTLPANLFDLPSYRAALEHNGGLVPDTHPCGGCGHDFEPRGLVCMADVPGRPQPVLCWGCAAQPFRLAMAAQEAAAAAALPAWETEAGKACKAERDRRINATLWTTAGGSPLTAACRAQWSAWRTQMHRITVDHPDPGSVIWPAEPTLDFEPVT